MLKVGDRVTYTNSMYNFGVGTIADVIIDNTVTGYAVEFDKCDDMLHTCNGVTTDGHGWYCSDMYMSLVPFKPGDKVIYEFDKDYIGTVIEGPDKEGDYVVKFDRNSGIGIDLFSVDCYGLFLQADELMPFVKKKEKPKIFVCEKPKFSVGDRVKCTGYNFGIGTVIERDVDGVFMVEFDKYNECLHDCYGFTKHRHGLFCLESNLEHVEESSVGEPETTKTEDKYKLGTRVRSIHNSFGDGTIVYKSECNFAVEFDKYNPGLHNCDYNTEENKGWWYSNAEADVLLEVIDPILPEESILPEEYTLKIETADQLIGFRKWLGKQYHNWSTFVQVKCDLDKLGIDDD